MSYHALWRLGSVVVLGLTGVAVFSQRGHTQTESSCLAALNRHISAVIQQSDQRSRWGVLVQPLDRNTTLYAHDASHYFIPASNAKLLTTAAALTELGEAFQVRTSVYQLSPDDENGSLVQLPRSVALGITGRGDPALTEAQLQDLAQQIRQNKPDLQQIDQLVVDDHYFQGDAIHPDWAWEDVQAGYGAPVNSLILDGNAIALSLLPQALGQPLQVVWQQANQGQEWQIDNQSRTVAPTEPEFIEVGQEWGQSVLRVRGQLRVGAEPEEAAIAITDPTLHFLRRFRQTLITSGLAVRHTAIAPFPIASSAPEIAFVLSPPLSHLLVETNQNSNNLYAESLLRQLGQQLPLPPATSSLASGLAAMEQILNELGVDPAGYALVDGSGLSRRNLASPETIVQVLQIMARSPHFQTYRNSLAIAGQSGTLRHRFVDTPVAGRLWGKTGALSGVAALSGYLYPTEAAPMVFSILVNHFDQPVRTVRPLMDEIVLTLTQATCGSPNSSRFD